MGQPAAPPPLVHSSTAAQWCPVLPRAAPCCPVLPRAAPCCPVLPSAPNCCPVLLPSAHLLPRDDVPQYQQAIIAACQHVLLVCRKLCHMHGGFVAALELPQQRAAARVKHLRGSGGSKGGGCCGVSLLQKKA